MKISILKRCGVNKIRGFVALPIIIGSTVLAVGVLGGLAYEYKNNQSILSSVNKNNLLAEIVAQVPVQTPVQSDQWAQVIALGQEITNITAQLNIDYQNGDIVEAARLSSQIFSLQNRLKNLAIVDHVINNTNGAIISSVYFLNATYNGNRINIGLRFNNDFDTSKYTTKLFTTCSSGVSILTPGASSQTEMCNSIMNAIPILAGVMPIPISIITGPFSEPFADYVGNVKNSNSGVGTVNFSAKVIDNVTGDIKDEMTVQTLVVPVPTLKLLSPIGGETLSEGQSYDIKWESTNFPTYTEGSIFLYSSDDRVATIAKNIPPSQNSYTWDVATNLNWRPAGGLGLLNKQESLSAILSDLFLGKKVLGAEPIQYKIKVMWFDPYFDRIYEDESDYFTISGTPSISTAPTSTYTKATMADTLLILLDNALADGVISASEKTNLLTALNSYLGQ